MVMVLEMPISLTLNHQLIFIIINMEEEEKGLFQITIALTLLRIYQQRFLVIIDSARQKVGWNLLQTIYYTYECVIID